MKWRRPFPRRWRREVIAQGAGDRLAQQEGGVDLRPAPWDPPYIVECVCGARSRPGQNWLIHNRPEHLSEMRIVPDADSGYSAEELAAARNGQDGAE